MKAKIDMKQSKLTFFFSLLPNVGQTFSNPERKSEKSIRMLQNEKVNRAMYFYFSKDYFSFSEVLQKMNDHL